MGDESVPESTKSKTQKAQKTYAYQRIPDLNLNMDIELDKRPD